MTNCVVLEEVFMTNIPSDIEDKILEFYYGFLPMKEFTSWLYSDKSIEETLGEEVYVRLISIPYETGKPNEVRKLIRNCLAGS